MRQTRRRSLFTLDFGSDAQKKKRNDSNEEERAKRNQQIQFAHLFIRLFAYGAVALFGTKHRTNAKNSHWAGSIGWPIYI